MTISSELADIMSAVMTPEVNGLGAKLDAQNAMLLEVAATQAQTLATLKALLDAVRALTGSPVTDSGVSSPPPVAVTPPPPTDITPPAAVTPPQINRVIFDGAVWSIGPLPLRQILRDGQVVDETALTRDVVRLFVAAGNLWQQNAAGDTYARSGNQHWTLAIPPADVTITANAPIAAPTQSA